MARSWPIHVVVLVIFLAATVDCATSSKSEAIPKKRTLFEKLENLVSSAVQSVRSVGSNVKRLYRNFDLIGALATEQLQSSVRAIKLLQPDVTNVTKRRVVTTQQPVATTTKTEACGGRWTQYKKKLYSFCRCTTTCTFSSARNKCKENQATLAKVASAKHEILFELVLNKSVHILFGGNDLKKEGTWRWPDGSLLNAGFTNWLRGHPLGGRKWSCMSLFHYHQKWNSLPCNRRFRAYETSFVCEKNL